MPSQAVSDTPVIDESLTRAVGGTGNVGIQSSDTITTTDTTAKGVGVSPSDSISLTIKLGESKVIPAIRLDTTFGHLNGRQVSRASTVRSTIREKLAICTVTFPTDIVYTTGGVLFDFTNIGSVERFSQAYLCSVTQSSKPYYTKFVPDTNNAANLGKMIIYDSSGVELTNGNIGIQDLTLKCYVRGF